MNRLNHPTRRTKPLFAHDRPLPKRHLACLDLVESRFSETSPYALEELWDLHPEWFEGDPRLEPLLEVWRLRPHH